MLIKQTDEVGNTVYSFSNVKKGVKTIRVEIRNLPWKDKTFARLDYQKAALILYHEMPKVAHLYRKSKACGKNRFIKLMLYKGWLDGHFPAESLKWAKYGIMPKDYDVHHIIPLAFGGTNELDNLVLIEKSVHKPFLHEKVFDYLCAKSKAKLPERAAKDIIPDGEKIYLDMPVLPHVVTPKVIESLFTDYETPIRGVEISQTETATKIDGREIKKTFAELVEEMRLKGELPPDPTTGAQTRRIRLVKKGSGFKRTGVQKQR